MSLFKKTLLECLAVFAVGGLVIGLVLAIDVIPWERIVFTDTTLLLCCLIVLLSVPVLYYGYKRKAETLSAEAQEAIRWVQFGMMFLLFLGILTCVFRNPGAVVVAVCFTPFATLFTPSYIIRIVPFPLIRTIRQYIGLLTTSSAPVSFS